jgi:hypothetical protein
VSPVDLEIWRTVAPNRQLFRRMLYAGYRSCTHKWIKKNRVEKVVRYTEPLVKANTVHSWLLVVLTFFLIMLLVLNEEIVCSLLGIP